MGDAVAGDAVCAAVSGLLVIGALVAGACVAGLCVAGEPVAGDLVVGDAVGFPVGPTVRVVVGPAVGALVTGDAVTGLLVGDAVGLVVGPVVGALVMGDTVTGLLVGFIVGFFVGPAVGAAVAGECVTGRAFTMIRSMKHVRSAVVVTVFSKRTVVWALVAVNIAVLDPKLGYGGSKLGINNTPFTLTAHVRGVVIRLLTTKISSYRSDGVVVIVCSANAPLICNPR